MVVKTPTEAAGVARLKAWAINPAEGGRLFMWGTPGDFEKCVRFYTGKLPNHIVKGWCANLHKLATGATPGHAPGELAAGHHGKH
jgi:hypothetical protein